MERKGIGTVSFCTVLNQKCTQGILLTGVIQGVFIVGIAADYFLTDNDYVAVFIILEQF